MIAMFLVFAVGGVVSANGLGGQRLEKVAGDQIVDIGTDQTSPPVAGEPIQFDFNLLRSDTRALLSGSDVAVNIEHNGKSTMKADLLMQPPLTLLIYTFPEAGDYTMTVTFYNAGRAASPLATASFPIAIAASTAAVRELFLTALLVLLILGLLGWNIKLRLRR